MRLPREKLNFSNKIPIFSTASRNSPIAKPAGKTTINER